MQTFFKTLSLSTGSILALQTKFLKKVNMKNTKIFTKSFAIFLFFCCTVIASL